MVSIGAGSPIGRDPYDSAASRRVRVLQAVDQKQVPEHRDPGKSMYSAYILHIHTNLYLVVFPRFFVIIVLFIL